MNYLLLIAPIVVCALVFAAWNGWLNYRMRRDLRRLTAMLKARQEAAAVHAQHQPEARHGTQ